MEYAGIAASAGYGIGKVFLAAEKKLALPVGTIAPTQITAELERLEAMRKKTTAQLEELRELAGQKTGADVAAIFTAQTMFLNDPEYLGAIKEKISGALLPAATAVAEATAHFLAVFSAIEDEYLQERAADLKDVSERLLRNLLGLEPLSLPAIDEQVIICAPDLTPSDTAQLDPAKIAGFITETGSASSHSSILARSLNIPAVVGVKGLLAKIKQTDFVIVDGTAGKILLDPPPAVVAAYRQKGENAAPASPLLLQPTLTKDGVALKLAANISSITEGKAALNVGAEGVGLYRTEFLYLNRSELPTEEEQFLVYKEIAELFGNKAVVIRTLDIGGDKDAPCIKMPPEANPFLGCRAIRLCLADTALFKTQLRAILRASVWGNLKIMYPMIATLQELKAAQEILAATKRELSRENIPFNPEIATGMMVEIPAAAILAAQFAPEIDFFSIGTNDLIQYTLAADRLNAKVAYLYQPFNPAVLRLIQNVAQAAHSFGKQVFMCGEMAGDLTAIPILLGLGLHELSMNAGSILPARNLLSQLDLPTAQKITQTAFTLTSDTEIKNFLTAELARYQLTL
ncbi:MAG: phosphoenolpyruvate--protein phosphotransferase [Sporomusaceae bacterium]|jgi:phosphotransferase system enzyme I (PtsI)|nr:phosphoenolpyruvate--protein phosphotransferase [Sporomusaceae bacterium]